MALAFKMAVNSQGRRKGNIETEQAFLAPSGEEKVQARDAPQGKIFQDFQGHCVLQVPQNLY